MDFDADNHPKSPAEILGLTADATSECLGISRCAIERIPIKGLSHAARLLTLYGPVDDEHEVVRSVAELIPRGIYPEPPVVGRLPDRTPVLIAGRMRCRGAELAGVTELDAIVVECESLAEADRLARVFNAQRVKSLASRALEVWYAVFDEKGNARQRQQEAGRESAKSRSSQRSGGDTSKPADRGPRASKPEGERRSDEAREPDGLTKVHPLAETPTRTAECDADNTAPPQSAAGEARGESANRHGGEALVRVAKRLRMGKQTVTLHVELADRMERESPGSPLNSPTAKMLNAEGATLRGVARALGIIPNNASESQGSGPRVPSAADVTAYLRFIDYCSTRVDMEGTSPNGLSRDLLDAIHDAARQSVALLGRVEPERSLRLCTVLPREEPTSDPPAEKDAVIDGALLRNFLREARNEGGWKTAQIARAALGRANDGSLLGQWLKNPETPIPHSWRYRLAVWVEAHRGVPAE